MEHGSSPTNYPGRTPIQIVGRLLFSVIILAAGRTRTSNQIFKESGSSPTSLLKAALLELECLVSDQLTLSDTPTFHNTLVVGSSPTSSTTQLRATGEFLMAWRAFALEREGCGRSKWGVD